MSKKILIFLFLLFAKNIILSKEKDDLENDKLILLDLKNDIRYEYQEYAGRAKPISTSEYFSSLSGKIILYVKNGQKIPRGKALFSIKREGSSFLPKTFYSSSGGIVNSIKNHNNDSIKNSEIILKVVDINTKKIDLHISDKVIDIVNKMDTFKAYSIQDDGSRIEFSVKKDITSIEPDYQTGLYDVSFVLKKDITLGAFIYVKIPFKEMRGIFVKKDLIKRIYGQNYIWITENNILKRKKITVLDSIEDEFLISGLKEGAKIPNKRLKYNQGDNFSKYIK